MDDVMIGMNTAPLCDGPEGKTVRGPSPGPDGALLVEEWGGDVKNFLPAAQSVKRKT
jgi:hypothetical protein